MPRNTNNPVIEDLDAPSSDGSEGALDTLAAKASEKVDEAMELARGVPETVDRAAATTGRMLGEAQRTVRDGSDAALLAGSWMTAGLALGLLVGRAPRLIVAVALVPAVALGMALVDRRSGRLVAGVPLPN
jgi:hypothetical protein